MFPSLSFINTYVLAAVMIFEVLGPISAKFSIFRVHEETVEEK